MSSTIRFPFPEATRRGASEAEQIIELYSSFAGPFLLGGAAVYTDISPWKTDGSKDESPFTCINLEFTATGAEVIGAGTTATAIGLFGCIGDLTTGVRHLLGLVGMGLGETFPRIVIPSAAIGWAQPMSLVAAYDGISIGGVFAAVSVGDFPVTVTARPFRRRDYGG
jgi:hypothetical protein